MRKRIIQTILLGFSLYGGVLVGFSLFHLVGPPRSESRVLSHIFYISAYILLLTLIVYSLLSEDKNEKNVGQDLLYWTCFCIFVIEAMIIVVIHLKTFLFMLDSFYQNPFK